MEGDAVEGPVVCVCREEVLKALNEMKTGKGHELSLYEGVKTRVRVDSGLSGEHEVKVGMHSVMCGVQLKDRKDQRT